MGFTQWSHGTLHGKSSTLKETEWAMSESSWSPNTDVYELDGGLMIRVEIAGMRREDLQLKAEGNLLRISSARPDQTRPLQSKFYSWKSILASLKPPLSFHRDTTLMRPGPL